MGKSQRVKGRRLEQEVVNLLKEYGVPAKRISMLESGRVDKGDIELCDVWKAEVKGGNQVPKFLYEARKEGEEMLIAKRDREKWLVTMDFEWFIKYFLGS